MKPKFCRSSFNAFPTFSTPPPQLYKNHCFSQTIIQFPTIVFSSLVACLHSPLCLQNMSFLCYLFTYTYPQGIPLHAYFFLVQHLNSYYLHNSFSKSLITYCFILRLDSSWICPTSATSSKPLWGQGPYCLKLLSCLASTSVMGT